MLTCRSSSSTDPSAQECLQLLIRTTQVFREEYIQKFEQAREEIARRYFLVLHYPLLALNVMFVNILGITVKISNLSYHAVTFLDVLPLVK